MRTRIFTASTLCCPTWPMPSVLLRRLSKFVGSNGIHQSTQVTTRSFGAAWKVNMDSGVISQGLDSMFQTVIGLEVHAQLDVSNKLFSGAQNDSSLPPNTAVFPLDVGVPGVLPQISEEAVQAAVLTAAACQCEIMQESRFERKHYFYADLPLGYQVTQQRWPLAREGRLAIRRSKKPPKGKDTYRETFDVRIDRIQLEQDTGKTTTQVRNKKLAEEDFTVSESLVDFNRAGCALVEIVFCPDVRSGNDAAATLAALRDMLKHIGACDGRMEDGSLRCDLNISIAPLDPDTPLVDGGDNPFQDFLPAGSGNRVEVKNLNSIRQVVLAAEYEAIRQAQCFVDGNPTERETRTFDAKRGRTVTTRRKEGAVDYRFLPEPDLPPLVLDEQMLGGNTLSGFVAEHLAELPEMAVARLRDTYGLSEEVAVVITGDPPAITFYEAAVGRAKELGTDGNLERAVANWLCNDLFALIKDNGGDEHEATVANSTISGPQLGELVSLVQNGVLSTPMGKRVLKIMFSEGADRSASTIADERGLKVISDMNALEAICKEVVFDPKHENQVNQYKQGGKHVRKIEKFFIGKAMGASKGNANPELLADALQSVLSTL